MANLIDTSAYKALDEEKYINELYDKGQDTQKKLLQDNYTQNTGTLDAEQKTVQQNTNDNLERTYVEAAKGANIYARGTGKSLSTGANQQAALSQGVTRQANVTDLKAQQNDADAEIERQRSVLAGQYAAAIKQAQAENDMERAQALYDAAKEEDARILELKRQGGTMLAEKGDLSVLASLLYKNGTDTEAPAAQKGTGGTVSGAATTGTAAPASGTGTVFGTAGVGSGVTPSWEEVRRNEDSINKIYDAQMESQRQALTADHLKAASELQAQRRQQERQTDQDLTDAYVAGLKGAKNYSEVQTAYGQGSGTGAQARLAQDQELLRQLTAIRAAGAQTDAELGMEGASLEAAYREAIAKANAANEQKRIAALYEAAKGEEAELVENQKIVGQFLANNQNNYALLGLLYGMTPDMIDRMQGTGAYAPSGGSGTISFNTWLANLSNADRKAYEESLQEKTKGEERPEKTPWGTK